ncbi:hypothetical protein Nmel_015108 [Mimus melanotis]
MAPVLSSANPGSGDRSHPPAHSQLESSLCPAGLDLHVDFPLDLVPFSLSISLKPPYATGVFSDVTTCSGNQTNPPLFHVAYVLIKFANSPRPDLWVLERSTDFGLTYEPWQYFASSKRDCIEKFGQHTVDRITRDDHAICTTEYSRIVPLENGEIPLKSFG